MRPAQIAASAACTQAEGSFRVEVFVSAFGRRRVCGRVHLQTHSRRTEKRCCFVLAAAAGRASRQERCKTLEEKARGEAFSAAFRYLDGCRAAFVRHAGLYAKDCGRAFLFGERLHVIPAAFVPRDGAPRRLSHAERLRRLTYRPFLVRPARLCNADARLARRSAQFRFFARSICAADIRPRFVFDAS